MDNMVVAVWYGIKGLSSFDECMYIYLNCIYNLIMLAHPICLRLVMIV